jgi:hypothetical protein
MLRSILIRGWLVFTIGWLTSVAYTFRDILPTLAERDWKQAIEYGFNTAACDLHIASLCRDLSIPFFSRARVAENWGLLVMTLGVPAMAFAGWRVIQWIFRQPKSSATA